MLLALVSICAILYNVGLAPSSEARVATGESQSILIKARQQVEISLLDGAAADMNRNAERTMAHFSWLRAVISLTLGAAFAGVIALGASRDPSAGPPVHSVQTPTAVVEKQPTAVAVKTVLGPREDCAEGWTYYNDPDGHFSFCYPLGARITTGPGEPGGGQAVTIDRGTPALFERVSSFVFTIYWKPVSPFEQRSIARRCAGEEVSFGGTVREDGPTLIAGQSVIRCVGVGPTVLHGVDPMGFEIPDPIDRGWIQVFAFEGGATGVREILDAVIGSIRIHGQ
jgi:hypothetical protein